MHQAMRFQERLNKTRDSAFLATILSVFTGGTSHSDPNVSTTKSASIRSIFNGNHPINPNIFCMTSRRLTSEIKRVATIQIFYR